MQYNIGAIFRGCVLTFTIFPASLEKTLLPKSVPFFNEQIVINICNIIFHLLSLCSFRAVLHHKGPSADFYFPPRWLENKPRSVTATAGILPFSLALASCFVNGNKKRGPFAR
jgi:hypothetical protein